MTTEPGIRKIVLAASADHVDQPWVADAAAQLAQETGAAVAVVSLDELETEMLATLPRSEYRRFAEEAAANAVARLREKGVEATMAVRPGPAVEGIATFAEEEQADVIVVGSSSRGRVAERLLGSVPLSLLQGAGRPVLVVTHPHER